MTDDRSHCCNLLRSTPMEIFYVSWARTLHRLMDLEAQAQCGAEPHERSEARVKQRNGYRARQLETRIGASTW